MAQPVSNLLTAQRALHVSDTNAYFLKCATLLEQTHKKRKI